MGVNFASVNNVVHYGPPRKMYTLLQQIGRARRDGNQSFHLLIYSAKQLRMCEKEVLDYERNQDQCRRTLLLKSYSLTVRGLDIHAVIFVHLCAMVEMLSAQTLLWRV